MSLKALARKHLSRDIQTAGAKGHDSKEDAIATGELVRARIRDSWKSYKQNGWRFEDDQMVAPPGQGKYYVNRQGVYVPGDGTQDNVKSTEQCADSGAGQKRKLSTSDDGAT
jgi:hypothetical protein